MESALIYYGEDFIDDHHLPFRAKDYNDLMNKHYTVYNRVAELKPCIRLFYRIEEILAQHGIVVDKNLLGDIMYIILDVEDMLKQQRQYWYLYLKDKNINEIAWAILFILSHKYPFIKVKLFNKKKKGLLYAIYKYGLLPIYKKYYRYNGGSIPDRAYDIAMYANASGSWGLVSGQYSGLELDNWYHMVWIPKYRKKILTPEVADYAKQVFQRIAEEYDMIIDTLEVVEDHVHIFLEAPPRLSPARIVQMLKSISARELFRQYPHLRRQLWGGKLWSDGYFVRAVGDEVTGDMIRRYIKYHQHDQGVIQLALWDE